MKKQLRALVSRWLCLAFTLKAVTTGDAAIDSPTPTLSQTQLEGVASALATQELPTVRTANGILSGKMENGVAVFKGIPFAAPPVGRLRWRKPHPATSGDGVRKADENGNSCVQPKGRGWR